MKRINPEVIARGVVFHGDRVLLCRSRFGGYSYLPGGHVEIGESASDALRREFEEEAGVLVTVGSCLWVHEHLFLQSGRPRQEYNIVFRAELPTSNGAAPPVVTSREVDIEFVWIPVADIHKHKVRPAAVESFLGRIQQHAPQPAEWTSDVKIDSQ